MTVTVPAPSSGTADVPPSPVPRWADHGSCAAALTEIRGASAQLRRHIPEVYRGFSAMHDAALAAGALDARTKELMALALAVSAQCDGCIAAHAKAAARLKATEQEVAEAIGVVMLMDGGPATVYGPRALATFQEFISAVH